ncbi:hypothetical protein DIC82_17935 [Clostridium beijerinckii]|nr:hypothetical protein DIC82_17935 [Clostridium beijerinckii]
MIPINKIYNLVGYWNNDLWDLFDCGLNNIKGLNLNSKTSYRYIDFSNIKNDYIKKELKYYIFNVMVNFKGGFSSFREQYLQSIKWFIKYLEISCENISSLENLSEAVQNNYVEFLCNNNVNTVYKSIIHKEHTYRNVAARFPSKIKKYFIDKYNEVYNRNPDIWYINDFNVSQHRINLSESYKSINFYDISNISNKIYLKKYIKYLLLNTETSISFIYGKCSCIKRFLKFLAEKNLSDIKREDIEKYKEKLLNSEIINQTYNRDLFSLYGLFEFGVEDGFINCNHVYIEYDIIDTSFKMKGKIVEPKVIEEILRNTDKFPPQYMAMFLLLYCCGMRISEVCILKVGSVQKDENKYYIRFYQQKMKKEVVNPIPKNLYYFLIEHQKNVIQEYGEDQIYLFPRKDGLPTISNTYKESMNKIITNLDIRNLDGSVYMFRAHEYRHTFATNLIEKDVPFTVIQKLLHHNSPEMSLVYTQLSDSRKQKKYGQFIDLLGNKTTTLFDSREEKQQVYEVQWLKNNLKAQALPNGFCSLPVSLGDCPYANKCLMCDHFKTTKNHLNILKNQLIRTEVLIEIFKEKNLKEQLEINMGIKKNLQKIISSLEEG